MTGSSAMQLVNERGCRRGLGSMLGSESSRWWKTRMWWVQCLIWVGILGFGAATAVGVSRMQQQKHWSSDVVMGAIVGTAVSSFVYKQQEKRRAAKSKLRPIL